ncbi:MAG: hypothetical protein ACE366_16740 [Bradymonadia bacterium]
MRRRLSGFSISFLPKTNTVKVDGFTIRSNQRGENDPIVLAPLTVRARKALAPAQGVTGAELRVFRVINGFAVGGIDPTVSADTVIEDVGFFGAGEGSEVKAVILHPDYRPASSVKEQTNTGETIDLPLEPDDLVYVPGSAGGGVTLDTGAKVLTLASAITGAALYSWLKDLWRLVDEYPFIDFPLLPRTPDKIVLFNGWAFAAGSLAFLRSTGLEIWSGPDPTDVTAKYANVKALNIIDGADQAYGQLGAAGAPFDLSPGTFDDLIDITAESAEADPYFVVRLRPAGKTFASINVAEQFGSLRAQTYGLTLNVAIDGNVVASDAEVQSLALYLGMSVAELAEPVDRTVGGVTGRFNVIVQANGGTPQQAYTFAQYWLRLEANRTKPLLAEFQGEQLRGRPGVFFEGLGQGADDAIFEGLDGEVLQPLPSVALSITFGAEAQADPEARFALIFLTDDAGGDLGRDYGTEQALIVQDAGGNPIAGLVGGAGSATFNYDYANNAQRGAGSAGTDAPVVLVVAGRTVAQAVAAQATITNTTALALAAAPSANRVYEAPPIGLLSAVDTTGFRFSMDPTLDEVDAVELASAITDWFVGADGARLGLPIPVRVEGSTAAGATIFIQHPWRITVEADRVLDVVGNVSLEGAVGDPWDQGAGARLKLRESAIVRTIEVNTGSGLSAEEKATLANIKGEVNDVARRVGATGNTRRRVISEDESGVPTEVEFTADNGMVVRELNLGNEQTSTRES